MLFTLDFLSTSFLFLSYFPISSFPLFFAFSFLLLLLFLLLLPPPFTSLRTFAECWLVSSWYFECESRGRWREKLDAENHKQKAPGMTGVKLNTRGGFCFRAVTALLLLRSSARASLMETAWASLDGFIVRHGATRTGGKLAKFWSFRLHRRTRCSLFLLEVFQVLRLDGFRFVSSRASLGKMKGWINRLNDRVSRCLRWNVPLNWPGGSNSCTWSLWQNVFKIFHATRVINSIDQLVYLDSVEKYFIWRVLLILH